jgi:hypothetical protein
MPADISLPVDIPIGQGALPVGRLRRRLRRFFLRGSSRCRGLPRWMSAVWMNFIKIFFQWVTRPPSTFLHKKGLILLSPDRFGFWRRQPDSNW